MRAPPSFDLSSLSAQGGSIGLSRRLRRKAGMSCALRSIAACFFRGFRRREIAIRVEGLGPSLLLAQGGSKPNRRGPYQDARRKIRTKKIESELFTEKLIHVAALY